MGGKALLEMSRVESGVLGNALDGVDMETKPVDEKDSLVEDTEAMTTDEKSEIKEKVAVALDENYDKHDLVARAHSGEIGEESEALILLAEVSMENSNFNQAVEDLTECLAKRIKSLPSDSRMIAETHYQLGVAQAHCAQQCADLSQ